MDFAAGQMRTRKARANFYALNCLNGHESACQLSIETRIPLCMRAETDRQPAHDDLENTAERIARRLCLVDARLHALLCLRVTYIQIAAVRHADILFAHRCEVNRHAADLRHMRGNRHTERREELTADGTDGNAHRRLTRTRTLEDIARVLTVVFEYACEIGMPWSHSCDL